MMEEFNVGAHMSEVRRVAFEQGRLEGRKEVVEWLERSKKFKVPKYQIKEWGLDEEVTTAKA